MSDIELMNSLDYDLYNESFSLMQDVSEFPLGVFFIANIQNVQTNMNRNVPKIWKLEFQKVLQYFPKNGSI